MLYLTSRAIGQTRQTRTYLQNIEQGDMQLPHGPIITSPDRLFTAFKREVIDRRPEVRRTCVARTRRVAETHCVLGHPDVQDSGPP